MGLGAFIHDVGVGDSFISHIFSFSLRKNGIKDVVNVVKCIVSRWFSILCQIVLILSELRKVELEWIKKDYGIMAEREVRVWGGFGEKNQTVTLNGIFKTEYMILVVFPQH